MKKLFFSLCGFYAVCIGIMVTAGNKQDAKASLHGRVPKDTALAYTSGNQSHSLLSSSYIISGLSTPGSGFLLNMLFNHYGIRKSEEEINSL